MHETIFAESAHPPAFVCLRLPLHPYSIGHELLLLERGNAFLCLGRKEFDALPVGNQVSELVKAVLTCYRPYADNARPERWLRLWEWFNRKTDYALSIADFRNYLAIGRNFLPALSSSVEEDTEAYEIANKGEKMPDGRACGAPLVAQLIHFGIYHLRMSHEQVMEAKFGYTCNLYFAWLEGKGSMAVENGAEMEARATMRKHRQDVLDEKQAARDLWATCTTDEDRQSAFEKCPRIGNLFAEEWNACATDEQKSLVEAKYPVLAASVLAQAGLKGVTICPV